MNTLSKICKDLIFDQPFYGYVLLGLQKEFTEKVKTAGVGINGINFKLYINPTFWNSLTIEKKKGLILHELNHIVFFHLTDFNHLLNKDVSNIAKDIEINQKIDRDFLPDNGCFLEDFTEYGLEPNEGTNSYYKKLMQSDDVKEQLGGESGGTGEGQFENGQGKPIEVPQHEWSEIENASESQKKLMERQIAETISNAIEQVKKSQGKYPIDVEQRINKILKPEPPKFNWRAYLRRFVGSSIKTSMKKTMRKKSLRFEHDFGLRVMQYSHILVGIDSSASVSDKEIKEFLNELHHMYKSGHEFTLIFADTEMQEPIKYNPKKELVLKKRGGTDFNPIVNYYRENKTKFSTLIYLTDGEAPIPEKPVKNMLWVLSTISSDADHLKSCGKVIKLN